MSRSNVRSWRQPLAPPWWEGSGGSARRRQCRLTSRYLNCEVDFVNFFWLLHLFLLFKSGNVWLSNWKGLSATLPIFLTPPIHVWRRIKCFFFLYITMRGWLSKMPFRSPLPLPPPPPRAPPSWTTWGLSRRRRSSSREDKGQKEKTDASTSGLVFLIERSLIVPIVDLYFCLLSVGIPVKCRLCTQVKLWQILFW